ncbi:MAG: acyltransferase family protein [Sodaliphilus sp.]|nr:acyltransferase family protein [Bacteroidales bacterium]MDY5705438.1 acyltransferase family protein [Sodaliphilus sp.]
MSAPASRTYHSIDILKVVAALLVVAIHARPFVGKTYPLYISLFSRMAVPVFFVVSAFFFFRKKPDTAQLKHYVRRMGWLYAFWFVVEAYFTIDGVFSATTGAFWSRSPTSSVDSSSIPLFRARGSSWHLSFAYRWCTGWANAYHRGRYSGLGWRCMCL